MGRGGGPAAPGARCHVTDCTVKSLRKLIPANQLIASSEKKLEIRN